MSKSLGCPCCEERVGRRGGFRFLRKLQAPPGACQECVFAAPPEGAGARGDPDSPPFVWPRKPEDIDLAVAEVLADSKRVLDDVAKLGADGAPLNFQNTIHPLMHLPCYKTNPLVCQAKHMQHCHTDAAIRDQASKATTAFANMKKESKTRKDVHAVVKKFKDQLDAGDGEQGITEYQRHYVTAILDGFGRSGLELSDADSEALTKCLAGDADACNLYKKNLGEDKTELVFDPEELEGCDKEWIDERTVKEGTGEATADGGGCPSRVGKVVLTLKYPDLLPVLQNCERCETRKKLTIAREQAYGNNLDLVAQGAVHRRAAARILGYDSWAHYICSGRMSGSPEVVTKFLAGIRDKAEKGASEDKERLRKLKEQHLAERGELAEAGGDVKLDSWDTSFYNALLLKREYGVDHEAIRKYFPCPVVVEGTLGIYQELLGLRFTEQFGFDTWHPEVRLFIVHDSKTGDRMGHFYLDLHPREGKYNHAAIFHLLKRSEDRRLADGSSQTPVDCMLTNLPAPTVDASDPTGATLKPALLRHDDVVTFFHEFGHIMHGLCAQGTANQTTLAKCPRDFVEAPSQMLENWCFNGRVLERLSKHVQTGESLPQDQIDKLLKAKNVNEGLMMLRQLYLSTLDLTIHGVWKGAGGEDDPGKYDSADKLQALVDELRPRCSLIDNPPGCNMLRNFGHLMNQYSAAYYGYLWAEVLSADMFESRFAKDPFSKEDGMDYRTMVLAVGGVGKIAAHLERFLGHAPREEPFLRSRGIIP